MRFASRWHGLRGRRRSRSARCTLYKAAASRQPACARPPAAVSVLWQRMRSARPQAGRLPAACCRRAPQRFTSPQCQARIVSLRLGSLQLHELCLEVCCVCVCVWRGCATMARCRAAAVSRLCVCTTFIECASRAQVRQARAGCRTARRRTELTQVALPLVTPTDVRGCETCAAELQVSWVHASLSPRDVPRPVFEPCEALGSMTSRRWRTNRRIRGTLALLLNVCAVTPLLLWSAQSTQVRVLALSVPGGEAVQL